MNTPPLVLSAQQRAEERGFALSCEPAVGSLLAALAAAVPTGGRICELGTGAGAGLAWLVHGIGNRRDLEVLTVDNDDELLNATSSGEWPAFVKFINGDGAQEVARYASFDLIFADAYGGKLHGLDATIAALKPRGVLIVDDMDPALHVHDGLAQPLDEVRRALVSNPTLVTAELAFSSGVIVCTKVFR